MSDSTHTTSRATDGFVWVIDLDGVIWLGDTPIPGAAEAVAALQDRGEAVVFATNNSFATIDEYEAKLARHGIDATGCVVSSSMAAAQLVEAGEKIYMIGGPGLDEALTTRGAHLLETGTGAETVVVGLNRDFNYQMMSEALRAIGGGARLIGTNPDATFPTAEGLLPGCGSLVSAVATAAGVEATFAGKPYAALAEVIGERFGNRGVVIGDRLDTDGAFAETLGFDFALVLSGVSGPDDVPTDPAPRFVAPDIGTLVSELPDT